MGRAKARAAKARKVKDTLDTLRDRDRKLSSFDRLVPPDSKESPPRILRSNIDSHQLPPRPPRAPRAPLPPSKKQLKKAARMEKRASEIEERVRLLRIEFDSIFDLTHIGSDIDTDELRVDNELFATQNDELGTGGTPDEPKVTPNKSRWQERQERREARLEQKETRADARREEKAKKATLKFDTFLIERLLARSHLSGDKKDHKVTRASSLPEAALQRSAGTEHTESHVEHVEQGGMDLDMDE